MPSVRITNLTPKPINVSLKQLTGKLILPPSSSKGKERKEDERNQAHRFLLPSLPFVFPSSSTLRGKASRSSLKDSAEMLICSLGLVYLEQHPSRRDRQVQSEYERAKLGRAQQTTPSFPLADCCLWDCFRRFKAWEGLVHD